MKIVTLPPRKKVHLFSGLVLASFILTHFTNHAVGLVSVEAMERMRQTVNIVWRSWPGTILLYGALATHFALALDSLYHRQTLRMPVREVLKILFGLSLPFLLVGHVIATRVEVAISGYDATYPDILRSLWSSTDNVVRQSVALIVAWVHGCLGIWFWLRGRDWFPRAAPLLFAVALLVPVLALLGFYTAARSLPHAVPSDAWFVERKADQQVLEMIREGIFAGLVTLIGGTLVLRALPRRGRIRVRYPDGRSVSVNLGFSVLEASRLARVPPVSVCGGRGRCSTCRVRVVQGLEGQPKPEATEQATLDRIGAPDNVRLACQFRPIHSVTVAPILDSDSFGLKAQAAQENASGRERRIAVMFCDLRDFTGLAEQTLPFDTVFLLNRYFGMVGEAVEDSGGVIDKFIGDGALALFGLNGTFNDACRQALTAAERIGRGIETLNATFSGELAQPLRIAIGMHAGPAIVGEIGYGKASSLTAVGDTINTASRLEGLAKEHNVEVAVSAELARRAGARMDGYERQHLSIRGRSAMVETWIIGSARDISGFLPPSPAKE